MRRLNGFVVRIMGNNFAVFILTHGRPDRVFTIDTLRRCGYSGKVFYVVDDEDTTLDEYVRRFGKQVIVFNKGEIAERYDEGDTTGDRRAVFYARNACFDIAKENGIDYFLQCDDDYLSFEYRYVQDGRLMTVECRQLDELFSEMVGFLESTGAVTVALAQGGDFIGGANGGNARKGLLRKAMNTFFCKTERPFSFVGRINEDVNTYVTLGQRGVLILTYTGAMVRQVRTQSNIGGMTELYLDGGTFRKSFYSVMYAPSCVKVAMMNSSHARLHHKINWGAAVPKILEEKWKRKT